MLSKKSLSYIKTAAEEVADKNIQQQQSLQEEFRNVKCNNNNIENNNKIEELKRKIDTLTRYQKPYISKMLNNLLLENPINAGIICNHIIAEQNEINIKESTKETKIKRIIHLSKFFDNKKSFYDMTKEDLLDYLNNLRKPSSIDPTHKSIGTWNARQMLFLKFFRWLYNQTEFDPTKRETPECMRGIKQLQRKELSSYEPNDMWTTEEHSIFLKYCPSIRDKCYHSMTLDTSARPHELLNLKIKDVKFKVSSEAIQYAEITVKGKTGSRTLPLIDSIPYIKEWILNHPEGQNPDSWLFVSLSDKNNTFPQLLVNGMLKRYKKRYKQFFRELLKDESISDRDKAFIKNMLTKPFNIYIHRHFSLTEKSKLNLNEHMLRNHAGWSMTSKMPQRYLHYFGSESSKSILRIKGIIKENEEIENNLLKPRHCPNCNESNIPASKFCIKCKMVLAYDSYTETLEKQKEKDNDIEDLKKSVAFLADRFNAFLLSQPGNKILYDDDNGQSEGIVKGIELKPEINNIAVGKVIPSIFNNKKN
jgi:integrase